ncbi:hypothetical protein ACX0HA_05390 [Flavobacterium hauense]
MKTSMFMLMAMLVFGIASAQVNKVDPVTAVPSPGTPPVENVTQQINRQQSRQASPALVTGTRVTTTSQATTVQPVQPANPLNGAASPYPGATVAYPQAQGALQPGTAITTDAPTGTNNQITTLPGSTTSNQGKVP